MMALSKRSLWQMFDAHCTKETMQGYLLCLLLKRSSAVLGMLLVFCGAFRESKVGPGGEVVSGPEVDPSAVWLDPSKKQ